MDHTISLFAAMTKNTEADRSFTDAAGALAHAYEVAFAKPAVADPVRPATESTVEELMQAARLRALIDAGKHLANHEAPQPSPVHAEQEVKYQVVSLTVRPDDSHINAEYFKDGHLLPPNEIPSSALSIYNSQLST
jgi:hypothetical protein